MPGHQLSAKDRLDIIELFARYTWAYDSGDKAAYGKAFVADGVLADENGVLGAGRVEIEKALQTFIDMRGAESWQHLNDHHLFESAVDGYATVRSYWIVIAARSVGDSYVRSQGHYVTDVARIDGEWLIKGRTFYLRGRHGTSA